MRLKVSQARTVKSLVKWDIQNVTKAVFSKIFQEIKTNTCSVALLNILLKGNTIFKNIFYRNDMTAIAS